MFRAPSAAQLPPISMMLDDIPASSQQIARLLGVTEQTLTRYKQSGKAPRAVSLALFWETRWGRSAADCEAANYGQVHRAHAQSLQGELSRLAGVVARLEADYDKVQDLAANFPLYRVG